MANVSLDSPTSVANCCVFAFGSLHDGDGRTKTIAHYQLDKRKLPKYLFEAAVEGMLRLQKFMLTFDDRRYCTEDAKEYYCAWHLQ